MNLEKYLSEKRKQIDSVDVSRLRTICRKCRKVIETCYCAQIRPFRAGAKFVILLHPKEGRKRLGTGRLTKLCIENSELYEGVNFTEHEEVGQIIANPLNFPMVLYPSESAHDLSVEAPRKLETLVPTGKNLVIFLVDGSWPCAKKMMKVNHLLRALPQLKFTPPHPSIYQIRRQPDEICFSTIESVHFMIEQLNRTTRWKSEPGHENLLEVFRYMIHQQLSFVGKPNQKAIRGYRVKAMALAGQR